MERNPLWQQVSYPQVDGSMRRLLHALVMLLVFGGTAWADDWTDCNQWPTDFDRVIRGCTRALKRDLTHDGLVSVYLNRASAPTRTRATTTER
jgi:hypothetical protein